jgi:predicted DNA-binding transcriptional regulator AlpA
MAQAVTNGVMVTRRPWSVIGVSRTCWYRMMGANQTPPPVSVGGVRYWRVADLEKWIAELPERGSSYSQPLRRVPA